MALIERINVGGSVYNIAATAYTTCSQTAATQAKVIAMSGLVIDEGVTIRVKFTEGNTATNPTLTVTGSLSSTGTDASTTAIPIMQYGAINAGTVTGTTSWSAGEIVALTFDGTNWIANYNANTTYTFAGGTNKITVTPSVGNAYDVTVTPSISNNITGSGTNGYLTKFSGTNTITNGPQLSSAISNQDTSTKFLRQDGTWAAPSYITDTHYTATLAVGNAATDKTSEAVSTSATGVYVNLVENNDVNTALQFSGAGGITIGSTAAGKITFTGKDGTVKSITPGNGLINGTSGTSQDAITTTGTISIASGGVTNDMLAGSIAITKLAAYQITIGNTTKNLGESFSLSDLGIAAAMNFKGTTTTALADGDTTGTIAISGNNSYTPINGDVVLYSGKEFVWTGSVWEELGDESSWALSSDVIHNSGTKGDLIYWSNTDTPSHLAIGTGNNKFLTISSGVPAWGTVGKSDVGLGSVTNHQQVHEVAWDSTNKKITRSKNGTAGDVVSFVQGTNVTLTGASGQLTIAAADPTVTQDYSTANKSYPLLFSATEGVTATTSRGATTALVNNAIYVNPSTGELKATKFTGNGSGLTNVTASSVAWSNVTDKVYAYLYVNATSGGANNDTAATDNTNTYIHLYDNSAVRSTIKLAGAGGTTVASTAGSKNITITSKKYKSTGSTNALTSLKLKYTDSSAHDDAVSSTASTPSALGTVTNAVLYIKSLYYGTTSVSTGVSEDNT